MYRDDVQTDVDASVVDVNGEGRVAIRVEQNDHLIDVVPFYNKTNNTKGTTIECSCGFENTIEGNNYGDYRDLVAGNVEFIDTHNMLIAECYSNIFSMN